MNTIPDELIAVPGWHGYFWHPYEEVLYSLKVGGVLRALKLCDPWHTRTGYYIPKGFNVSNGSRKNRKSLVYLRSLTRSDYKVPYAHEARSRI